MNKPYKMINFYELNDVKKLSPKYHNPTYNENTQPLKHPFRAIIVGASGSGKSNLVSNIINVMGGTFNSIIIFTMNKHEPIYEYLESAIPKEQLQIHEGLSVLNRTDLDDGLGTGQTMVIFDDLVLDRAQSMVEHLFIRGRKLNDGAGISVCYLTQSYYLVPSIIRKNINFLFVKKLSGIRDRRAILKEAGSMLEKEELEELYEFCTSGSFTNFLLLCLDADDKKRYRRNFDEIIEYE